MSKIEHIKHILQHYVFRFLPAIFIVGFVLWFLFLDENSYLDICKNDRRIRELEKSIAHEEALIIELQEEISDSESDVATIDRIAREKHGMQCAHEDVYIIVEANDTTITPPTQEVK